tara:strand:- start:2675 stop:3118 length:444 start_codon:yes stop_codon:yes gene_type:complete
MPYKDLNRNKKTYSFIRRKPANSLVLEDKNVTEGTVYEVTEHFTFLESDVSNASGNAFVTFTTDHALNEKTQALPYISIVSMDSISGAIPYVREATRAIGSDKLTIDVYFKSQLSNPTNTYKVSQTDLQTAISSSTINISIKMSYIV